MQPATIRSAACTADELSRIADLAAQYGAFVISDGSTPHSSTIRVRSPPFLSVVTPPVVGVAAHSAGFSIAGAKCALTVSASDRIGTLLDRQPRRSVSAPASSAGPPPKPPSNTATPG